MPKGKQGRIRTSYLYSVRRRRRIIQARRDQQRMQNEVHALPDPDAADFPEDDNHLFHQVIENDNQAPPRNHHHDNEYAQYQRLDDQEFMNMRDQYIEKLTKINQLHFQVCHEKIFISYNARIQRCKRCSRNDTKFSEANNMYPGEMVPELSDLTAVEKLLIAQVNPTMTIHRLPRGGQYGFKGHVLNVSQNVGGFITQLPRRVDQLDLIVLKKDQPENLPARYFTVETFSDYPLI